MVILLCATSLFATMIALAGFGKLSMMIRSRSDATSAAKKDVDSVKDNVELAALKEDS